MSTVVSVVQVPVTIDAARARNDVADIGTPLGGTRHPCHLSGITLSQPLLQKRQLRKAVGRCDPAQIESNRERPSP